jgi:hypothetical protein
VGFLLGDLTLPNRYICSAESAIFDRSFNNLASEIETNVLKALKVVTLSDP